MPPPADRHAVAVFRDPLCHLHDVGGGHPERPERLQAAEAAIQALIDEGLPLSWATGPDATDAQLGLVHAQSYLTVLRQRAAERWRVDPDTQSMPQSYAAAVRAAGLAAAAVDTVLSSGGPDRAFVLCRPPGHHALANRGMGFCLLNNIAIAAAWARRQHGLDRVAIVDFDVHHGNGTEAIFAADANVLFVSTHQGAFYPGTGRLRDIGTGAGEGFTVNLPLPAGADDALYCAVYEQLVARVVQAFAPELLLVSAGYDLHVRDPLAMMQVSDAGIGAIASSLVAVAEASCAGRAVFVLEGGYDLEGLAGGVAQTARVLCEEAEDPGRSGHAPLPRALEVVAEQAIARFGPATLL